MTKTMEVNELNEDEMILVVVGDDDGIKKYEISDDSDRSEPMPVPISVKIEPIEDARSLYCTEDVRDIFPIAVNTSDRGEYIEVKPDIEELDEEYLSQEDFLEEELIKDDSDKKEIKTNFPQKKRAPRKTQHKYLLDEEVILLSQNKRKSIGVSSKNKKRKTNVTAKKRVTKKEPVDEDDFLEIEYLEDDIVSPKKVPKQTPISDEDFTETEFLDDSSKRIKRKKNVSPEKCAPKKVPASDEEFLEIEYLEDVPKENKRKKSVSPKKRALKTEDDEEYLPDEEDQEEFIKEEYVRPKRTRKKPNILSREPAHEDQTVQTSKRINRKSNTPSKKQTQKTTLSKKPTQKAPEKPKKVEKPVIKSFIAELCKKQPIFKENREKLVEYIAELMRKRRPPPPLPNSYIFKDEEYSCSYCDVDSPTIAAARRHFQAAHGPRYLVCFACGYDFRSTANLYKHEKRCRAPDADIQLRARGVFVGRKGKGRPYLTKNKYILGPQKITEMPDENPTKFYCPHCPAVYCRNGLLKEHMHKHTGFRPFQCHECPATYVSRHQLNKHAKKHSDEQYICDHCGKVLKMKTSLISHMDTHLPRPRYGCGRCGRRYAQRSALKVHIMRDHMNLPPPAACPKRYYCSQCPAYFTREYLLDEHMHKHTGFRAFQCPDCPAAYVSRHQLKKHSKKHSDMQYICDHCGRVFKLKTALTSHMDTHLPRPRFGCGRCGRRYAKRAAVRVHIMRDHMHMPPPAACPVCPKRYNRLSDVKFHMKRNHGLTMLTKRSIERELPYMKVEDLKGAKVVFNKEDGIGVMDINPTLNEQILP